MLAAIDYQLEFCACRPSSSDTNRDPSSSSSLLSARRVSWSVVALRRSELQPRSAATTEELLQLAEVLLRLPEIVEQSWFVHALRLLPVDLPFGLSHATDDIAALVGRQMDVSESYRTDAGSISPEEEQILHQ